MYTFGKQQSLISVFKLGMLLINNDWLWFYTEFEGGGRYYWGEATPARGSSIWINDESIPMIQHSETK